MVFLKQKFNLHIIKINVMEPHGKKGYYYTLDNW